MGKVFEHVLGKPTCSALDLLILRLAYANMRSISYRDCHYFPFLLRP